MEFFFHFFGTPIVNKAHHRGEKLARWFPLDLHNKFKLQGLCQIWSYIVKENYEFIENFEHFEGLLLDND
jgi:hypothetical protein